ncbi:MAG: hypothetical protein ACE5GQ_10055 [Nitrospinales bacterium]
MGENRGLRAIALFFWIVGSIFWLMIAVLSGDIIASLAHIAIGWGILFAASWILDAFKRKPDNNL